MSATREAAARAHLRDSIQSAQKAQKELAESIARIEKAIAEEPAFDVTDLDSVTGARKLFGDSSATAEAGVVKVEAVLAAPLPE